MEKFIRNFLAIGLGSYIGSDIALRVNGNFFWVGLIAGGIFGYLSVEFGQILAAMKTAWKNVIGFRPTEIQKAACFMVFMMSLNAGTFTLIGFAADKWALPALGLNVHIVTPLVLFSIAAIFAGLFKGMFDTVILRDEEHLPDIPRSIDVSVCRIVARYCSPIKALSYWPMQAIIYLRKGILWSVRHFPAGMRHIGRFGKTVFLLIHNDKRMVRLYYCALGSLVGYLLNWPLAGFLIGGLAGAIAAWAIPKLTALKSQEAAS